MARSEEAAEHGRSVTEDRPQKELRTHSHMAHDSAESIQRGGGEDPRRREVGILIERKIRDNDQSGYNHQTMPNQQAEKRTFMASQEGKAADSGEIQPDGRFAY
jgi:hypothetical protein